MSLPTRHTGVKNVFLDIDDTLWENNLYFLQSHQVLFSIGRECGQCDMATYGILEGMEDVNIPRLGFGYNSYEASLLATVRVLVHRSGRGAYHAGYHRRMAAVVDFLRNHPIVWMPGVRATLPELTRRFRTIIVTKGNPTDQMAKVDRCGLKPLFHAAEVVPHKYASCYTTLLEKYGLNAAETVMVGNSPKSDINNARRAGLRTVYIPHPMTWYREMEPILEGEPQNIEVHRFDRLLQVLQG